MFNSVLFHFGYSFEQMIEYLKLESVLAYEWLIDKHPSYWSRAFFDINIKCDMLYNNMCEAFNSAILLAHDKPIITLLEIRRNYLMNRMTRKRGKVAKWKHPVGPKIFKYLEKVKLETDSCQVWLKFVVNRFAFKMFVVYCCVKI